MRRRGNASAVAQGAFYRLRNLWWHRPHLGGLDPIPRRPCLRRLPLLQLRLVALDHVMRRADSARASHPVIGELGLRLLDVLTHTGNLAVHGGDVTAPLGVARLRPPGRAARRRVWRWRRPES